MATPHYTQPLSEKSIAWLESLDYITPPERQGQAVIYSYAAASDGEGGGWWIERVHDQSDGETAFYVADCGDEEFAPWNQSPEGDYEDITEDMADHIRRVVV